MGELINTTTSTLKTAQSDFSVAPKRLDSPGEHLYWDNPYWSTYYGYFSDIPPINASILALVNWAVGLGFTTDAASKVILEHITGWGEDDFQSVLENLMMQKLINGDGVAEIIRAKQDDPQSTLVNIKPLSPERVRWYMNEKGIIDKYEVNNGKGNWQALDKSRILHISNNRIGDQIHGTSLIAPAKPVIDKWFEVINAQSKVVQRNINPLKIFEVNARSSSKLAELRQKYHDMTKDYEAMFIPEGNFKVTIPPIPIMDVIPWIQYLENLFYKIFRVPKIIATSEGVSEAGGKVGFMTFDPVYTREQTLLESDLWNKLGIKVKFNRPPSLGGMMQNSEQKNTGQTGIQQNEVQADAQRTE